MTATPELDRNSIVTALLDRVDDPRTTLEQLANTAVELAELRTQLTAKEAEYSRLAATAEKFGITTTQLRSAGLPTPTASNAPRTRKPRTRTTPTTTAAPAPQDTTTDA